jgi:hypothetical protein
MARACGLVGIVVDEGVDVNGNRAGPDNFGQKAELLGRRIFGRELRVSGAPPYSLYNRASAPVKAAL